MPYIKDRREELIKGGIAKIAGELNFQLTYYLKYNMLYNNKIVLNGRQVFDLYNYMSNFLGGKPNYQKYNDLYGAVICCYNEFHRRYGVKPKILKKILSWFDRELANYEDEKINTSGDV